jgi:hypothetical protein
MNRIQAHHESGDKPFLQACPDLATAPSLTGFYKFMHILAGQIARDIKTRGLSAVYEPELSRVWPKDDGKRKQQIEIFAKQHGWRLCHYKDGFVAIFDKEPDSDQQAGAALPDHQESRVDQKKNL